MLVENNFYNDCEVEVSLGGNTDYQTGPRFNHCYVLDNVMADAGISHPTNRELGWGIDIQDWDTGAYAGNVVLGSADATVVNTYAARITGHCSDTSITDNVFYNVGRANAENGSTVVLFEQAEINLSYTYSNDDPMANVAFSNNYIQNPVSLSQMLSSTCASGVTFTNNEVFSASTDAISAFNVLGTDMDFTTWNTSVGGTNTYGSTTFTDDTRNVVSYMAAIGGTATKSGFYAAIRAQSIDNWDANLTGGAIAAYIKAGFTPV